MEDSKTSGAAGAASGVIAKVILWQNGMIMVFGHDGQQVPEFQGPRAEALPKLRAAGWAGEPEERIWRSI